MAEGAVGSMVQKMANVPATFKKRAISNLIRKNINQEARSDTASSSVKFRGSPKLRTPGLVAAIARVNSQDLEGKINGRKWKNIITIDEAWVYLTDINGIRKIYYKFWGEWSPERWTKFWKESHLKGVMFVAGVCSRGITTIRFIKPGAKINSEYYIQHVLKPLFKNDIRKLFSGEHTNKVVFRHDSVPAHSSGITQEWL
ncbi:hypothetical protein BV898_09783 [Hypsibius exemplaris]|uniref:Tc1-like transposase DDE domain-containing protein n=1 Tax=Hypsibius exemplaris TaxID=2072580 RepID=A0A1W0WLR4_HYPEX|nr:hypothetical protein BV898_09783 [Hypsibius exemplaris]